MDERIIKFLKKMHLASVCTIDDEGQHDGCFDIPLSYQAVGLKYNANSLPKLAKSFVIDIVHLRHADI